MNNTESDTTSAPKQSKKKVGRWRRAARIVGTLIGLYAVLATTALLLARGSAEPYIWNPPSTPVSNATEQGSFQIIVSPETAAVDAPVSITVQGLEPGTTVVLQMSTSDARDMTFESWAEYLADEHGNLNVEKTAPERGTYTGKDGNGLLWSMRTNDASLFHTSSKWRDRDYLLSAINRGARSDVTFTRSYPFASVSHSIVGGDRWKGELTVPAAGGPFPAVIALGGWDDGPMRLTSALLASRGYAVLNLGYHGWEGLPEELVEIPLETVTEAIDWFAAKPGIATSKIGLFGISKGAELALAVAARDSRVSAVAAWAPASVAFPGISFRSMKQRSSWIWQGQPLPFATVPVNRASLRVTANLILRRPVSFRPTYATALALSDDASAIPIESISGEVLLVAGAEDLMWPAAEMSERLAERVANSNSGAKVKTMIFDDAGHGFYFSLWPKGDFTERFLIRGGSPEAAHRAGQLAWIETLALFSRM